MATAYGILPLVALILFVTFQKSDAAVSLGSRFTGEQIFRGLFFGEGEVAANIPELNGLHVSNYITDAKKLADALDFQNRIVNQVKNDHPGYFSELKAAVDGRNHVSVQNALQAGSGYVEEAVAKLGVRRDAAEEQRKADDLAQKLNAAGSIDAVNGILQSEMEAAAAVPDAMVCVAILLLLFLVFVLVIPFAVVDSEFSALYQERLVDSVTRLP